jgi:hypothetical protein
MIKCGTIAAVVIAGSAAGTATLVSNPGGTQQLVASDQSPHQQTITVRGTRSELTTADGFPSPIGDQPRRGERAHYQPAVITAAAVPGDTIRRGTR